MGVREGEGAATGPARVQEADQEKYRLLFENMDEAFMIVEVIRDENRNAVDVVLLDANPAWSLQSNHSLSSWLGKRLSTIMPDIDRSLLDSYGRVESTGGRESREERDPATGRIYENHIFRFGPGKVGVLSRDITARKLAEQELRETAERARRRAEEVEALMDIAPVGIWVAHDPESSQITSNQAANGLYEIQESEARVGIVPAELWTAPRRFFRDGVEIKAEELPLQQAARTGEELRDVEIETLLPSGRRTTSLTSARPLFNDDGTVRGSIAASMDITELKRSNEELQHFAYVASHDLKEPLRMVTSYLGLLEKRCVDRLGGEGMNHLRFARDGAVRMQRMIDDLLAYSRVEVRERSFATVDMGSALETVLRDLNLAISESGASVTHDELPTVLADREQMVLLLENLVGNAIKYRGVAAPQIHISAGRSGGDWIISVRDNGIGIDPKYADKLFKMFSRLHTWDEYEGTGMGLVIAKKIVERHGGRIWFESREGEGTTFYFTIPESSS